MKGSTGGGSFSQSGNENVNGRCTTTGGVRPSASILSRIFCLLLACFTRLLYVPAPGRQRLQICALCRNTKKDIAYCLLHTLQLFHKHA